MNKIAALLLILKIYFIPSSAMCAQTPIKLTPDTYNHDLVVEAAAVTPWTNHVTGTMDNLGPANKSWQTWYENGLTGGGAGGLPTGAGIFTSAAGASTLFELLPYTHNNALRLDVLNFSDSLTLVAPQQYSSLSLLAGTSFGPAFIQLAFHFADGTPPIDGPQSPTLIAPNWVDGVGAPAAFVASGSVLNLDQPAFQHLGSTNPRLYQIDVPLPPGFSDHPLSRIEIRWTGTQTNAVTAIFGLQAQSFPSRRHSFLDA
jgi:hypothetical protein